MIFFVVSRFPSICASDMFFGIVFSVIRKIVMSPMSIDENPSFIKRLVFIIIKMMPIIMSIVPIIFARMCGCFRLKLCFFGIFLFLHGAV